VKRSYWLGIVLFAAALGTAAYWLGENEPQPGDAEWKHKGCERFIPSQADLVAHAGGGTPEATYRNDEPAMNLAASHGFELIELDFMAEGDRLAMRHNGLPESSLTIERLMQWLDAHPQVRIVTDVKTDNVEGLTLLKAAAGNRLERFIPQIYRPEELEPVTALAYPDPILTVYRMDRTTTDWVEEANRLPLRAVTMPFAEREVAKLVDHPVYLHTVNESIEGYGLYTDCLIPAPGGAGEAEPSPGEG